MKRIDERDTMFSRMNYAEGEFPYEDYYSKNPDKLEVDKEIRQKPNLCGPGTMSYNPINSPIAVASFKFLGDIMHLSEGEANGVKTPLDKKIATKRLKGLATLYGASLVGTLKMKDYHYYSHRGRHKEVYGEEVNNLLPYGLVFAVEMDKEMINRAPQISEIIETSKGYVNASIIGMVLSYYIRELGYNARNHMDANYLTVAPLVAQDAGLGQIGRNGILTTKEYGSRVRLGIVTTDLELLEDSPIDFGLEDFCNLCGNCAITCPGKSIPKGQQKDIDGSFRWQINQESCYDRWRSLGTDCGICINSCPFSQGINMAEINTFKDNKEAILRCLKEYRDKYNIRPYIKDSPEWLK
ncbi:reductive dehalogenase domain-containing protein [Clostridium malenominatum]|uniref:Reductive dehalogenase domain-containing protein n=1 Tax=Clostridium malenominatum TaxID=1539 RepID=A0ABP3TXD3_9CLOT